jgi:hypothetical protein
MRGQQSRMAPVNSRHLQSLAAFQTIETIQGMRPEWLRIPAGTRVSGLSRTQLFNAIAQGYIRSVHIKRPGAEKGIRLVNFQSLMDYITSFEEGAK